MLWYHDSLIEAKLRLLPSAMMTDSKQSESDIKFMRYAGALLQAL